MKRITTTLLVYFSLLTYSNSSLYGLTSLYEEQILTLGKKYEREGEYQKAFDLYGAYQKDNEFSEEISRRLTAIRPLINQNRRVEKEESRSSGDVFAVQVLTTKSAYRKAAEREKRKFESYGLNCYLKEGNNLYLRCNPSKNRDDLNRAISILKSKRKDYFIIKDSNIPISLSNSSEERVERIRVREERSRVPEVTTVDKRIVSPEDARNSQQYREQPAITRNPRGDTPAIARNPRDLLNRPPSRAEDNEEASSRDEMMRERLHLKGGKSKYTVNEGYKALNSKRLSKAKEIFGDILKYNEDDIDASFGYALAFMNEGDWVKAYITLGKVIDKTDREDVRKTYKSIIYNMNLKKGWKNVSTNPDKSIAYFQKAGEVEMTSDVSEGLAYAYNNNKEYDRAIPVAEKLFSIKKDFKSANLLVEAYLKANQKEKARDFFNSLDPNFQANMEYNPKRDELLDEVKELIEEKHYHQAKSLLRELYLMYPTNMKVLLYFAKVYQAEEKYKNALEYYRTILSKDEKHSEALMGLSKIYIATEKYTEALQTLSKLKEDNTLNVDVLINGTKLKLYLKDGDTKEALVLAKEMLLDDPTNVELYVILGDLNVDLQKNRDAYFYYGRAFQLAPEDFEVRMKLLNLLLEQNLFDQTQTLLGKFDGFQMTPTQRQELRDFYVKFYKKYTAVSLEEKDYVYALKGAKAGLQMEPNDTFFIESAGWAGLNSKNYNDAVFYFSKILAKDPDNYTIRYGMGLAYVNLKQFDKAKEYFKYAEKSSDVDLLYKVAEIYKDTGFKKDSYRVIKLIEELGRHSISGSSPQKSREIKMPSPTSSETPSSKNISQRDSMNTFNPFIIGGNSFQTPALVEQPKAPEDSSLSNALPQVVPEPDRIEIKKKSGSWF